MLRGKRSVLWIGMLTFAFVLMSSMGVAAQKVIRYAHFQPASIDQPKHAAALAFKFYVEANTNGEIEVQVFPASQLGNEQTVLEGLQLGSIQLVVVHDGPISGFFPPFQVYNIPYLFNDQTEAWAVFESPFTEELGEAMRQQTGIRMLAVADNGVRHFTNDVRPITSPDDLEGLKIRVQPGPLYQELVTSLGASSSTIAWPELPAALQQGVVDGQENGVTNILAADMAESQQYVTLDGHIYSVHAYLMNDAFFSGLTGEQQEAVEKGVEIAKWIHRGMTTAQDMNAETILAGEGMEVTSLTPNQISAFREAAQPPVVEWLKDEVGDRWVDDLLAAVEELRK